MRPFTSTISLDDARQALGEAVTPIDRTERVRLEDALGRVCAVDVRSAMDGYAVVSSDTAGASRTTPITLRVVERIYTGRMPQVTIASGACAEIATGAPLPSGADAVVMVEETAPGGKDGKDGNNVSIFARAERGQNVSPRAG